MKMVNGREIPDIVGELTNQEGMNKLSELLTEMANAFSETPEGDSLVLTTLSVTSTSLLTGLVTAPGGITAGGIIGLTGAKQSLWTIGANSSVAGSGYHLTASLTKALAIYADDNATLYGEGAVRTAQFRNLITLSHSNETSIFGSQSQLKLKPGAGLGITLTTGNRAGSWNYLEMAGNSGQTITLSGSAKATAGCFSMVEWDGVGSLTLSSGHNLAGFAALTNVVKGAGTFTQTGKFSAFTAMNNATASYSKFKFGLYLPMEAVEEGIRIGESSSTAGSGITLSSSQTAAFRVHSDDGGAALGASAVRGGAFRTLVTVSHSNEVSIFGCQNQLKIANPLDLTLTTGNRAGSWNYLEMAGTADKTITLSGANKATAGAFAMVEWDGVGSLTLSANHVLAGYAALTNVVKGAGTFTQTGIYAAFASVNNAIASYSPFSYGLYLADDSVTTGYGVRLEGGAVIGSGSGAPSHSAAQGSIYLRTGQAINATIYVNTNGTTEWTLCDAVKA